MVWIKRQIKDKRNQRHQLLNVLYLFISLYSTFYACCRCSTRALILHHIHFLPNTIKMQVMLSHPRPPKLLLYNYLPVSVWFGERHSFLSKSAQISFKLAPILSPASLEYIQLTISSFDFRSQTPSQPIKTKSKSSGISYSYTSGLAVIGYSSGEKSAFCLCFRSPRALVKFKFPSTRPSIIVEPLL